MLKAVYLHAITASAVALDSASILDLHDLNFYALKGSGRTMKGIVCGDVDGHGLGAWAVFNRHKNNAYFDSVAVYGAVSESQAQSLVETHFKDGAHVVNHVSMTDQALGLYLDGVQQQYALSGVSQKDADLFDAMTLQSAVAWDDETNTLQSHGGNIHALMQDLKKTDINDQLLDAVTPKDIISMLCVDESGMFDAVVIKYNQLDKYVAKLAEALKQSDHEEYFVKSVTPIEPFKRNGVVNVGAIFEMSDTQTITVLFNNPDSTPTKLTGQDIVTSWKWILNKRDVTAALQPRSVDAKKYPLIASRIYQLLAKNHQRFRSAQLIRKREELMLERAVGELEASQLEIRMLDDQIAEIQKQIDEQATANLNKTDVGKIDAGADEKPSQPTESEIKKAAIIEELKVKHDFKDAVSDEAGVTAVESPNGHTVEFWLDEGELELAGGGIALDGYDPDASAVVIAKFIAHKDFESQFEYIGGEERDDEIIDDKSFFDGKTTKFALTVTNLEKAAEALGFETVYNDFSATEAVADLFDSINAGSRFIYGMTVQIGKGSKVYARGEINENGDIKLFKGATGADPLDQHGFEQISTEKLINSLSLIDTNAEQAEPVEPSTAQEEQTPAIDFDKYLTAVDRSYFVTVPFSLKDGFKKLFPSAKWNNAQKQWVVGKTKVEELKQWILSNIAEIDNNLNQKQNFAEKLSKMAKLHGDTFDIKDQLKEKFGAIFHKETKGDIVSAAWYVEPQFAATAQDFVNQHMQAKRQELQKLEFDELAVKLLGWVKKSDTIKTINLDDLKEKNDKYRSMMEFAVNKMKSEMPRVKDERTAIYKIVYAELLAMFEDKEGTLLSNEQKLERFENDLKRYADENNFTDEGKGNYLNGGLKLWYRIGFGDFHIFKRNPNGNISHMKSDLKFDEKQVLSMDYNKIKEIVDPLLEEELKIASERRAIADTRKQNIIENILAEIQKSPYFFKDVSVSDIEKQNTNFGVEFGNFWRAEMKESDNDLIIQSEKSAIRQEIIAKLLEIHPDNQKPKVDDLGDKNTDVPKVEPVKAEETTISDKQKLKIVFKKEAEKLLGSFDYRLTDLSGHTRDEFKRADVPGKLNPIIAEAKAMLQRKFRDEWQREMLEKDVVRAENEIERWEKAQFKQAPLVNGEIKKFLDDVIAGNLDLSDQKIGDKLIKIGENLDPSLETLFQVAAAKYAEFAMNLQF